MEKQIKALVKAFEVTRKTKNQTIKYIELTINTIGDSVTNKIKNKYFTTAEVKDKFFTVDYHLILDDDAKTQRLGYYHLGTRHKKETSVELNEAATKALLKRAYGDKIEMISQKKYDNHFIQREIIQLESIVFSLEEDIDDLKDEINDIHIDISGTKRRIEDLKTKL